MEVDKKEVGNRIKAIRLQKGWTLEEMGNQLGGANKVSVHNWESGRNLPNKERLKAIADIGNISVGRLLYGDLKKYILDILKNSAEFSDRELVFSPTFYYVDMYEGTDFYPPKEYVISEFKKHLEKEDANYKKSRYDKDKIKETLEPMVFGNFDSEALDFLLKALYSVYSIDFGFIDIYSMYMNNANAVTDPNKILIKDRETLLDYFRLRNAILEEGLKESTSFDMEIDLTLEIADNTRYINKILKEIKNSNH